MSKSNPSNMAASVRQRLLTLAHQRNEEYQFVLTRYALERLLYRLSCSPHGRQFVLKGAMLVQAWVGQQHRSTMDMDLLGYGDSSLPRIEAVFRDVCSQAADDDGIQFDQNRVSVQEIRKEGRYRGVRVLAVAMLGSARIPVQVDVGFGDAVTPEPVAMAYPTLLDVAPPMLQAYPRETVIAEKYEAMVSLGLGNSRMKDFYDIWMLAGMFEFDGANLARAIGATFARRETPLPADPPLALSPGFYADPSKQAQWVGFVRKGRLATSPPAFKVIGDSIGRFLWAPTVAIARGSQFAQHWPPGGPWTDVR